MSGSGIIISCTGCGSTRELSVDEVTSAPNPRAAAEKVLKTAGWDVDNTLCPRCLEEAEQTAETPTEEIPAVPAPATLSKDDLDFELPVKSSRKLNVVEPAVEAKEEYIPSPIVIFEEKDVRIVLTEAKFDEVERAHRVKDGMGKTRYAAIDLGNSTWVIQELARALFERETGQEPPRQHRVYMGGDKYIPTPNVI